MRCETISAAALSPGLARLGSQAELVSYCREDCGTLAGRKGRWAVVICPGGAYQMLAPTEGEPAALAFLAAGVQAFVLRYSVAPAVYPTQLLELGAAVAYLRDHAAEYGIDRVAVCGFSAGGHLAGCLANLWEAPALEALGREKSLLRPDAAILCYPAISAGEQGCPGLFETLLGGTPGPEHTPLSLETSVSAQNPPSFLWCTCSDQMVPMENTLLYAGALRRAGVLFELHIFPSGPHAMSIATEESAPGPKYADPHVAQWLPLCLEWLQGLGKEV